MTELLSELDFSLDMPTDGVVESRNEVVIDSSAATHTATTNNIIRLYMTSSGFVDPHSVQIFADVTYPTVTAVGDVIPGCHFFSDVRVLSQRGDVLEEVNNAQLLSQKLHEASSDADYMNCGGSFSNSQKDPSLRQVPTTTAVNFRMNITDVLGIFSQPKYLHMASFGGGLQLELRCASNESVMTTRVDTTAADYSLSNVRLHYEEVLVSRGYMDLYNEKLQQGGYALSYATHSHLQSPVTAGETQVALNKTASKVKYVFSTVRQSGDRNKINANETATDSRVSSYQYQINGKNYPSQPVRSKAKAYQELLEANGTHKDNRTALICYKDFNDQWEFGASGKTGDKIQNGTYAAWMNLEKSASSALSGTGMTANSSFLKINVDAAVTSAVVDTFVCFERVLSVQPDRVVIVD